jgi:hypothetical protein
VLTRPSVFIFVLMHFNLLVHCAVSDLPWELWRQSMDQVKQLPPSFLKRFFATVISESE